MMLFKGPEAYHQRIRMLLMGGRKYQAKAWQRMSQFMIMAEVMLTAKSWL